MRLEFLPISCRLPALPLPLGLLLTMELLCRRMLTVIYQNGKIIHHLILNSMALFKNRKLFKRSDYKKIPEDVRMNLIERACKQVSRGVFFSTVIIITSFLPVFLLTGQEGKLFGPLAYTKSFIMVVDAILVVTLAPVLISLFMKGRFLP